ncbi:unnamed protein product [Closterium sp. NIES-54]
MVQQVLQRFGFTYSSPQATPLPTRHSLSALPSDESVESSGPYPELVGCLMYLMTCTRPDLAYPLSILARYVAPGRHRPEHMAAAKRVSRYLCSTSGMGLVLGGRSPVVLTGHADASWADDQATQRSSQGYTFGLGSGSVSWRATRSSSVLRSSCEAEIYAGAMAAQELRWLTYLLTDLGEPPRSPPVLYVDNKAMLALCREQRLEHRTKHIALHYFLARELQQRGQLRLAYVASEANTADVFTKALAPCDHQRSCTQLGLDSILGASPLMDPCFVVPLSPPLQSTASHSPSPTAAALSLPRTLDFVLDSAATDSVFRDAGILRNFPRPLSIDGAGETMTLVCTGTSSLPCPASPSGAVHSIVIFITTTGTSLVSHFITLRVPIPSSVHHTSSSAPPVYSCDYLSSPNLLLLRNMVNSKLLHDLPSSLPPLPPSPAPPCTLCVKAKLSQSPHPSSPSTSPKPLDLVHMDL